MIWKDGVGGSGVGWGCGSVMAYHTTQAAEPARKSNIRLRGKVIVRANMITARHDAISSAARLARRSRCLLRNR